MRRKQQATKNDFSPSQPAYRRSLRRGLLFFILPVAVLLAGGGMLAYLFQGQPLNLATIHQRIETTLQNMVGDGFVVEVTQSGLSPALSSILALRGEGIHVRHRESRREVLFIERVDVGLDIVSALTGKPQFDRVELQGGRIVLPEADGSGTRILPQEMLRRFGGWLAATESAFRSGSIEAIEMRDISLQLPAIGRTSNFPVVLNTGSAGYSDKRLLLQVEAEAAGQAFNINADWRGAAEGGRQLSLGIGKLPTGWWLQEDGDEKGFDGGKAPRPFVNANVRLDARLPFDAKLEPLDAFVKLQASSGTLHLGKKRYDMPSAVTSFSISPDASAITLENGDVRVGGQVFRFSGRFDALLKAGEEQAFGLYAMMLDVAAESLAGPQQSAPRTASAQLAGKVDIAGLHADFDRVVVTSGEAQFAGSAMAGREEGIALSLGSSETDVATVIGLWPDWVAPKARKWVREHVTAGGLSAFDLQLSLSPEKLAALKQGGAPDEGELSLSTKFSSLDVAYHRTLPPLETASGSLTITGDRLEAASSKASIKPSGAKRVQVSELSVTIAKMSAEPPQAKITARLSGPAAAVAALADSDPLNAIGPLGIRPADLAGEAKVRVSGTAPLVDGGKVRDWRAVADLSKLTVKKPLLGHTISDGKMEITADARQVAAKGKAKLDGFAARFDLAEPINGAARDLRRRDIRLSVTTDDLVRQNIRLAPVVSGPLEVRIQSRGDGPEHYEIDLSRADVSLPWIGWRIRRGSTNTASAKFHLDQEGDVTRLKDFSFRMDGGRKARGDLSFSTSGLIRADMKGVALNRGDDFDVSIVGRKGGYDIRAGGRSYDSRPVLQMVIHGEGLSSTAGNDVSLSANFGHLGGFNGRVMESVVVRYETRGGRLHYLDVKGAIEGKLSQVSAQTEGDATSFRFRADNAGGSLAMVNLYDKMRDGKLSASLRRSGAGPFVGKVAIKDFVVVGEERLASLTSAPAPARLRRASGRLRDLDLRRVKFDDLKAGIIKSPSRLEVEKGWLRNGQIGLTFDGILFDEADRMNLRGTFMPLFAISRVLGEIPLIGDILSNGKNSGLIGITYRLRGPANNPQIAVNPLSIVAPGIFREIFEFRN